MVATSPLPTARPGQCPPPRLEACSAEAIRRYFDDAWSAQEALFDAVRGDALIAQPDPLRHPLIFYLGHPAVFYLNKLVLAGVLPKSRRLSATIESLFARGVDPHRPSDLSALSWPPVEDIRTYRSAAYALIHDVIDRLEIGLHAGDDPARWALLMAIEHDRIHFETSSVLIRQLPIAAVTRPAGWTYASADDAAPPTTWASIPARVITLGRGTAARPDGYFGWDNEFGSLQIPVAAFEAGTHLVTNADFLRFVRAGGYERSELWSDEGWSWRVRDNARAPRFWRLGTAPGTVSGFASGTASGTASDAAIPSYRGLFDVFQLPAAWPAEVNGHEAAAFCAWFGAEAGYPVRLPSEAEFEAMSARGHRIDDDVLASSAYNLNLRWGSPCAVGSAGEPSADGVHDLHGNVWQWLADDFAPLPGFKRDPLYADFSSPYFDDQHARLRGGAWATTGASASRHYRLWFRRHFHQHAGFRMVRTLCGAGGSE